MQQHVEVGVGSTVALNVTLEPGQVQQTVTVSSNAASIETQTSDIGTTITPREIKDLPLTLSGDMRNPLNFVLLTPGVSASTPGPGTNANARTTACISAARSATPTRLISTASRS